MKQHFLLRNQDVAMSKGEANFPPLLENQHVLYPRSVAKSPSALDLVKVAAAATNGVKTVKTHTILAGGENRKCWRRGTRNEECSE